MKIKRSAGAIFADVIIYATLSLYALATIIPMLYVLLQSFAANTITLIPQSLTIETYQYVFSNKSLVRSLGISFYVTAFGTFLSLFTTCLMAYALSCRNLVARKFFMFMAVLTMIFSGGMIPTFLVVKRTGLLDTPWALMLPSLINTFNLIVLKNFFQSIPNEIQESAQIDGCNDVRCFFSIVLPLSLPAVATFLLFYAVAKWNMYYDSLLYIRTPTKYPVQVFLRQILFTNTRGESSASEANSLFTSQSIRSAVVVVTTVPVLTIYPFLQKHFTAGVLVGSVKG